MLPLTKDAVLKKGMKIPIGLSAYGTQKKAQLRRYTRIQPLLLSASKGPEYKQLSEKQHTLLTAQFSVSPQWNRMAIQLTEKIINNLPSMYTSPVLPGTVQLTPSGRVIILMRDCQTTGGYPRILQMSAQSLNVLAQMQQGDSFLLSVT